MIPFIRIKIKSLFSKKQREKWIASFKKLQQNKDAFIFLVFLLISTTFWFFNALRDNYTADFSYSLRFVNVPDDEIITGASHEKVQFKIRANGYTILRQRLSGSFIPVSYDVSQMRRTQREGDGYGYVLSSDQQTNLRDQLLIGIDLLEVTPDTIFIKLDELVEKPIPIGMQGQINLEKQFIIAGNITFEPESIIVSGPKSIMDTLEYLPTRKITTDNLRSSFSQRVELQNIPQLNFEQKHARITIPVEPFSEKTITVPIQVSGLPDSLRIKTFPSEINVTFRAGLSQFEQVHFSDFKASVDGNTALSVDRPQRLRVRLEQSPENVHAVDYSPLFVEYLIERKR